MSDWGSSPSAEELRAIQELSPETVRSYLASVGWRPREAATGAALWTLTDGTDEFEVMLPTDRRLRDFGCACSTFCAPSPWSRTDRSRPSSLI
jgi:hypothetical protein